MRIKMPTMRITLLVQLLVLGLIATGFMLLGRQLLADTEFETFEATEECMIDLSQVLAASIEVAVARDFQGEVEPSQLAELAAAMDRAHRKRFEARIFKLSKTEVGVGVYVTNAEGVVIYGSDSSYIGKDFSAYNDVLKTLRGQYGARSTRAIKDDPRSSVLYVAAPIEIDGKVVGVVSVSKEQSQVRPFIERRVQRITGSLMAIGVGVLSLSLAVFFWLLRPIRRLADYASAIGDGKRVALPEIGRSREALALGRAMEEMKTRLEGRRYVERYVQTLTHELKSPLAAIRGAGELLEEPDMPADQRTKFLQNIRRETDRSQRIIERLLQLSKLESLDQLETTQVVAPRQLVDEALAECADRVAVNRLTLDVREESALPSLQVDPLLVRSALVNLLENAIKFSPSDAAIVVMIKKKNGCVEFVFRDAGAGVPDYAIDRVFDHFYSLDGPDTGRKGSGLGLALVREVASLHGGHASLTNRQDSSGAVAVVAIPCR